MSLQLAEGNFDSLLKDWGKARLDGPVRLIVGFDDAARQLIAVGAIIQASYVAAFGFGNLRSAMPPWGVVLLFAPLILMIFCAARIILSGCRKISRRFRHTTCSSVCGPASKSTTSSMVQ